MAVVFVSLIYRVKKKGVKSWLMMGRGGGGRRKRSVAFGASIIASFVAQSWATFYAVKKMISENGFSDNQFSSRIFPTTRYYLTAYQNKKGSQKSCFHRLLRGVCTLYSIGESVYVYTVCCMF